MSESYDNCSHLFVKHIKAEQKFPLGILETTFSRFDKWNSAMETDSKANVPLFSPLFKWSQDKRTSLYPGFALEPGVWRESML